MTAPAFIEAAGLKMPIADGGGGPQLDLAGLLAPLGWVVNAWVQGRFPDLLEQVARGEGASKDGFYAVRAETEDLTEIRKAVWKHLTGENVGDDPMLVGSPMTYDAFVIPRRSLVEILRTLATLRATAASRPSLPPAPEAASSVSSPVATRESLPAFLEAAGLKIPIIDAWGGLQLDIWGVESLAWLANHWIQGKFPELLDHVEQGEDVSSEGFYAVQPLESDLDEDEERIAVWRTLTGTDIGDHPVFVGSPWARAFLLPRQALIDVLRAFARWRSEIATYPRLPPDPERRSAEVAQLFTRTPSDRPPTEFERIVLGDIEDLARALNVAQARATTEDDRAAVFAMRRQLLDKLEFYGLLDEARAPEKRAFLEGFRLPKLRDYVDAAMALRAYYHSPTRAKYNLGPPPQCLLDGDVSLDWFRVSSPTPAGITPQNWLATAEQLLGERPREGEAGEIFSSVAGHHYRIRWRRDHGRPAVVAADESSR